jgi:hypothetical protein
MKKIICIVRGILATVTVLAACSIVTAAAIWLGLAVIEWVK